MRRFFAPPNNFNDLEVTLNLEESKHLRDVLRLREGEEVFVFDGEGNEFACRIAEIGRGKEFSKLEILKKVEAFAPESPLDLTLAIALLKGEKFDLVVQKATELGVNRLIPLITARTDVKTDSHGAEKRVERWRKITLEAAKQCGRAAVPKVDLPVEFKKFVGNLPENVGGVLFSEKNGVKLAEIAGLKDKKLVAAVGSEGGWEDSEIESARQNGFRIITLGGRILRAETAGIAAVTLLQHIFGDLQ